MVCESYLNKAVVKKFMDMWRLESWMPYKVLLQLVIQVRVHREQLIFLKFSPFILILLFY